MTGTSTPSAHAEPARRGAPDAPSMTDPIVGTFSQAIGGPLGRHAVNPPRRRFWIPPRVILLSAILMFAAAWLQKYPCAEGAWIDHMQYTQFCYSDIRALWGAEHLDRGAIPYFEYPVEYPVLTGVLMGALGLPSYYLLGAAGGTLYWHLTAIVMFMFGLGGVAAMYRLRPTRPWDAMMLAVAPTMVFTALVNWDLMPAALTLFFLLAWSRGKPVAAGLLFGVAIAAKFYPLLIAGPLLVLAFRHRRLGPAMLTTAIAAGTWLAINLPFILFARDGWLRFFELNSERPIDWGTLWYVLRHFTTDDAGSPIPWGEAGLVNLAYLLLFVVACAAIAGLGLFANTPPRLAQLVFLVVAAFLLSGKVWSQQYVLWLIPLAVLARPKWRAFLMWQVGELCYFFAFYGVLLRASGETGVPEWVFITASLARMITLAVLCGLVVREILDPSLDVVRDEYGRDPDGLLFAEVPRVSAAARTA
ncbi:glycosyltransferase family 87 protein [Stackebrandtia soli]|uniref:glycosyltransferase family 87 protein n=1 Tax=Stackebrandtia soli TaxID=1892856 RepID=UPI0039E7E266